MCEFTAAIQMYISGTSGNDNLVGTSSDDVLNGADGNDKLDGGAGNDELYGGNGSDTYIIRDRFDSVYDTGGVDSGIVYADFYKADPSVESWSWAPGVQKLPYWIDALLPGAATTFVPLLNGTKTIYYCFPTTMPSYFIGQDANGFKAFTAQQQTFARQAFAYISSIIDIHFVEATSPSAINTIVLADNIQTGSAGYTYFPFDSYLGSDVLLNYAGSSARNLTPQDGDYSALTLIHELGHALGLKHPFMHADADGTVDEGPYLPTAEDTSQWTVMSYTSRTAEYHLRYSPLDIATLQYLYGPSAAKTTDDIYTLSASEPNLIWDGGGNDSIDGSALTQALTLYMEPGYWGYIGSKAALISAPAQVTVNFGTVIENAKGGAGDDIIVGNSAANRIYGQGGNDTIEGGKGDDIVDGGDGNDTFVDMVGNDALYGGKGTDRLSLSLNKAQTHVMKLRSDAVLVSDDNGNLAMCRNLEQVQCADGVIDLASLAVANNVDSILAQIYIAAFRRAPETEGYNYWAKDVAARGLAAVAETIFSLDVVKAIYPSGMSSQQFVTTIYNNVFNRAPDTEGLNFWMQRQAGESRGQLVIDMTNAALGAPDGAEGKDFFQNRLDWSLYAVSYQSEQHRELTPSHLITLTDGVNGDSTTLVALIGQAECGVTI
jgi:Ca2+-binding RTX toxin-like protein